MHVEKDQLENYLGKERFHVDRINDQDEIGIVRGLAWTSVGGDTLQIEVNVMPGKGEFKLTGQLGDVMKESAQAGISYIRSVGEQYDIPEEFLQNTIFTFIFRKERYQKTVRLPVLPWQRQCCLPSQRNRCVRMWR